jgi:hypothetical protein
MPPKPKPKPPANSLMRRSTRIINKKSQHVERDSLLRNETYLGRKNVGRSGKEDGSETIARVQPKKNGKALAAATGAMAQAMVQAKTKGRGSKPDGKIPRVIAIHKKNTDVFAETDGISITINRSR